MSVNTAKIIKYIRGTIKDLEKTDGRDCFEYDMDSSFSLSANYVNSTGMKVYKNGTELTTGWAYNSSTNKVTISTSLIKGDNIIIVYSYYEKYSDTELPRYIESNLIRFISYRYSKSFYMDGSDEVVAVDEEDTVVDVTDNEKKLIALITAIDIDPQNVTIRMPDFTISASENASKTEQIGDLISRFTRSFGVIDWLQTEEGTD